MTELNGVRLPAWYNGIGLHDSPGCYVAVMGYGEALSHANELKDHGCTLYKLFVSGGNKVERARGYVDNGVLPIVRDWVPQPWGRPPATWVMPVDQVRMYADAGVQLFEIAGNEVNIGCEWIGGDILRGSDGIAEELAKQPPVVRALINAAMPQDPAVLAAAAVHAFEVALNVCAQVPGTYPLLTSCTPGGNVDHRRVYPAIVAELNRRGLMPHVKHVAIHPRPHNNPPDTRWSATNTVTFDEWRWIRDQFGPGIYFWATEHGYSLNDDQNHDYPQIDLQKHTDYNWTLMGWMDGVIEPQLAGFCHWFEAGWGHWGAWPKDALRDSIVPEMPAPSPLWLRMRERVGELEFNRYEGDTPPPPEPPPPGEVRVVDLSGIERDWAWVQTTYGAVEILPADGYRVIQLTEVDGIMGFTCTVLNEAGGPVAGQQVAYAWPDGEQIEVTNANGVAEHTAGAGEGYWPPGPGPISWYVVGADGERVTGLGWLNGTNHRHLQVTMRWNAEPQPPPEPPPPDFRKPFDGSCPVTCDFACHNARASKSPGVDYATPLRTPALAVREGIVVGRGRNDASGVWLMLLCHVCEGEGAGWYLVTYRHLDSYTVPYWAFVTAGRQVGLTGNTGQSTGSHLHIDVRLLNTGKFIDPESLFQP